MEPLNNTFNAMFCVTNTKIKTKILSFITLFVLCFIITNSASAQGVIAGTNISNIAVVNYTIDNVIQSPIESSPNGNSSPNNGNGTATTFVVDRKIDLLLTGNNNTNVTLGDIQSEVTFTLSNEGNDNQTFGLTPNSTLLSDNFDTSNCTTTVTAVSGTPLSGVVLPTTGNIKLAPDQQASISVKCDIPLNNGGAPINSGDISLVSLTAITLKNGDESVTTQTNSQDNSQQIDTVFADNAGTDDAVSDASHSARRTYTALTGTVPPTLSINKSIIEVKDPNGGSTAITGSEVKYKIQITTQGIGNIENVVVTDITPAEMTYKPASLVLDGSSLTDTTDSDSGDFGISASNTATVNLGTIIAGSQYEIQLTYIIN